MSDSLRPYAVDYSPPGSSVHGVLQARILEWLAVPSSRESSQCRDQIHISYFYLHWEVGLFLSLVPPGKPTDWIASVIKKQGQQRIHFVTMAAGLWSSQRVSKQWHRLCWQDLQGYSWRWCQSKQQGPEAGGRVGAILPSYSVG